MSEQSPNFLGKQASTTESFDTTVSWASKLLLHHLHCRVYNLNLLHKEEQKCTTAIMNEDDSETQRLKDAYNSGSISFDEYTEALVQLIVSFLVLVDAVKCLISCGNTKMDMFDNTAAAITFLIFILRNLHQMMQRSPMSNTMPIRVELKKKHILQLSVMDLFWTM